MGQRGTRKVGQRGTGGWAKEGPGQRGARRDRVKEGPGGWAMGEPRRMSQRGTRRPRKEQQRVTLKSIERIEDEGVRKTCVRIFRWLT